VLVGGPGLAWRAAADYRAKAARELFLAHDLAADQRRLEALVRQRAETPPPAFDGTSRGLALSLAERNGLAFARIEPDGGAGVRVSIAPAPSVAVYRFIAEVGRAGHVVGAVSLVRAGEDDRVIGDISLRPSSS
jgi:hypothetical protein